MNKNSEKVIERKLVDNVKANKGLCIKLLSVHFLGLPDRMVLLPKGQVFFAEIKTTGEKPRKIQLHVHKMIRELGFNVYVIDKLEQIEEILPLYTNLPF
ncbi:MAG: VRR-NUC domain-containing protein [Niameybacter sp.]